MPIDHSGCLLASSDAKTKRPDEEPKLFSGRTGPDMTKAPELSVAETNVQCF